MNPNQTDARQAVEIVEEQGQPEAPRSLSPPASAGERDRSQVVAEALGRTAVDGLLADWRGAVATVAEGLEEAWPRPSGTVELEIDRFLAPRHRHHAVDDARVLHHPDVAMWVKEAHAGLIEPSVDPASSAALARLKTLRVEFDRVSEAAGAVARS